MGFKELHKGEKALRQREMEHKRKQTEQEQHDLLANESAVASMSAIADDCQCPSCFDLMAMAHSLRCGHTFCGLCIFEVTLNPKP
jgi:hypothetical protein